MKNSQTFSEFLNNEKSINRLLVQALIALVVVSAIFGGYYYWDRYVALGDVSPVEQNLSSLETYIRENPEDIEARVALAEHYYSTNQYNEAIAQSEQILASFPENDAAMLILGLSYFEKDEPLNALPALEGFVEFRSGLPMASSDTLLEMALYFLGDIYVGQHEPEKAIEVLTEALVIDYTDADAMFMLGQAYALNSQPELAIAQYHNAVRFVPDFYEAYSGMAESYAALVMPYHTDYARGMQALFSENYDEAVSLLEPAAGNLPDFAPAHLGLALAYEKAENFEAAELSVLHALELDPQDFMAQQTYGRIKTLTGNQ